MNASLELFSTNDRPPSAWSPGYYRSWLDSLLMRFTDLVLTVPGHRRLVVMAGRVGGTAGNWLAIALIVAALSWPGTARVVRAVVLSLREQELVEAARAAGARTTRILLRHVLPHAVGPGHRPGQVRRGHRHLR